jgi:ribosome maturation factor RimP
MKSESESQSTSQETDSTSNLSQAQAEGATPSADRWVKLLSPLVNPLGFEVVYVELQTHRQKVLRLFIDFLEPREGVSVGIEDCVKVARALDEPLDKLAETESSLKGAYELEVSSPGVDRPLRTERDFERFKGREVRIHTYRALSAEELANAKYREKNPKQKNFLGVLGGLEGGKVLLAVSRGAGSIAAKKSKKKNDDSGNHAIDEISIPFPLISKANLEPSFDFED